MLRDTGQGAFQLSETMIALVEQEEDFQFPLPGKHLKSATQFVRVGTAALGHNLSTRYENPSYLDAIQLYLYALKSRVQFQ
jgi:hypothetical protein